MRDDAIVVSVEDGFRFFMGTNLDILAVGIANCARKARIRRSIRIMNPALELD